MKHLVIFLALLFALPRCCFAELQPDEVAIIAVRRSGKSRELAAYYAKARKIPESQICLIDVKPRDRLSRADWEKSVRPSIRRWIVQNGLDTKVRCLVTVWDVPLKIASTNKDADSVAGRRIFLTAARSLRVRRVIKLVDPTNRLPGGDKPHRTAVQLPDDATVKQLAAELDAAFKAARSRLLETRDAAQRQQADATLLNIFVRSSGLAGMLSRLLKQRPTAEAAFAKLEKQVEAVRGRLRGLIEGRTALEAVQESISRDEQILNVMTKTHGLLGSITWIDQQLELIKKNETYACFDSELSLLYWPDYPVNRWQSNILHYRYDGSLVRETRTTLMVSRLEAPTFELAKKLIDTSIEVEKTGLKGKVYLDTRGTRVGLKKPKRGSTAEYDGALRSLATILKERTDWDVTLDNTKRLFQAGDCPETALYCGWYSLAKYVDAFDWQPGSVGYHIASGEASTLRNPSSEVWCKRMLEDGVCATLGPVREPYLAAFPKPDEFFVVLLSGRYTLAETYYRTKPFNSWVMVLVGDPLYNPFKQNPQITTESLPQELHRLLGEKPEE